MLRIFVDGLASPPPGFGISDRTISRIIGVFDRFVTRLMLRIFVDGLASPPPGFGISDGCADPREFTSFRTTSSETVPLEANSFFSKVIF